MQLATGSSSTKRLHTIKAASIYSDRGQHSAAAHIKCGPDWRSNSISGRRHKEEEKKKAPAIKQVGFSVAPATDSDSLQKWTEKSEFF